MFNFVCLLVFSTAVVTGFVRPQFRALIPSGIRLRRQHSTMTVHAASEGGDNSDVTALTSALSKLDEQWQIQQHSSKKRSRWSKLALPKEEENSNADDNKETVREGSPMSDEFNSDYVWLLEPPSLSVPSCVIVFTGGAGLGLYPHIAYSQLLTRLSDRLNAAVLAAPYPVGLDHFALAKQTGGHLRRALLFCEDDPSRQYPSKLPVFALSHSLGGKLLSIYLAATGQKFDGIGFMSFNNFSFSKTVSMARVFAEEIGASRTGVDFSDMKTPFGGGSDVLDTLFGVAENVMGAMGIDFSPNSQDTNRLIQLKYDEEMQSKTRLFIFDNDELDCSNEFLENCQTSGDSTKPTASGLPGTHLAPVYFKFVLDDIDDIPDEAREMAGEAMGGFQSASFGDEADLNNLVDEVCGWILGEGPTRNPTWRTSTARDGANTQNEAQRRIEGGVTET